MAEEQLSIVQRERISLHQRFKHFVKSALFNNFIIAVIVINAILVGVETYRDFAAQHKEILSAVDNIILVIFVVEIVLKILAEGTRPWRFFLDPWNLFDFFIVAVALLPVNAQFASVLRLARLLRVARVSRIISRIPRLQLIISALLRSIPAMGYVSILLGLVFYVFAVLSVFLYGQNDPVHFGSLQIAVVSLFRAVTMEDWTDLMYINMYGCDNYGYDGMAALCTQPSASPVGAALFFIAFIMAGGLIVLNFFVGIVLSSLDEVHVEEEKKRRVIRRKQANRSLGQELAILNEHLQEIQKELESVSIHYQQEVAENQKHLAG